jgi:cardiolipin hydrolase
MLRTCRKTLDIAIFTLTNDKIAAAILEAFARGVKIRIIADDECCKMMGSDVFRLALAVSLLITLGHSGKDR